MVGGRSSLIQGVICGLPESNVRSQGSADTHRGLSSQGHQGRPKVALRLASLLHCIQTVIQRDVEEAEIVQRELVNPFVLPVCVHDVTSNPITMDASSSSSGQRLNI